MAPEKSSEQAGERASEQAREQTAWPQEIVFAVGLALGLATVAAIWREPSYATDRDIYQQIGQRFVIPDCSSLHCTRVLVAWVIEHVPGPSLLKWKLYSIAANTAAALGVARLCRWFGLSQHTSWIAAILVAFGRGSQLTLLDPYTSDPFIYALTPWATLQLVEGRVGRASLAATVGVFAKEFAAGPLWIFTLYGALVRRTDVVRRVGFAALAVTVVWLVCQVAFAVHFNYSYGGNPSSQLQAGGYLARWIGSLGWFHALASLALHLLPILLLAAAGYPRAPKMLRDLTLASVPAAIVLCYVQQPDRALWNFEWAIVPLAVLVLDARPVWLVGVFVVSYAILNLPALPETSIRVLTVPFVVCLGSVGVLIAGASRSAGGARQDRVRGPVSQGPVSQGPVSEDMPRLAPAPSAWPLLALLVAVGLFAVDIAVHRAVESDFGVNIWGYRGPVARRKTPGEIRVVILGGRQIFGRRFDPSIPKTLDTYLNIPWMRENERYAGTRPMSAINLATPYDRVPAFLQTLRDFDSLEYDVVCLYIGHDDPAPSADAGRTGWRRRSTIFRATRYLPVFPVVWNLRRQLDGLSGDTLAAASDAPDYRGALEATIEYSLLRGKRVLVATNPLVRGGEALRQDEIARWIRDRYGDNRSVRYQDMRPVIDTSPGRNVDGDVAESLSQNVFRLLNQ